MKISILITEQNDDDKEIIIKIKLNLKILIINFFYSNLDLLFSFMNHM